MWGAGVGRLEAAGRREEVPKPAGVAMLNGGGTCLQQSSGLSNLPSFGKQHPERGKIRQSRSVHAQGGRDLPPLPPDGGQLMAAGAALRRQGFVYRAVNWQSGA